MYARSARGSMKKIVRNCKPLGLAVTLAGGGFTPLVLASALRLQRKITGAALVASRLRPLGASIHVCLLGSLFVLLHHCSK